MTYVSSQAFAGRGSVLAFSTNPPSVAYTPMSEAKTLTFSGSKYDLADVTNYNSGNFREWLPTLADSGDISVAGNLIPNDATEAALIGYFNNATLLSWKITLPSGPGFVTSEGNFTFLGYVQSIERSIPHDKEASITVKIKITGQISFTAGS